MKKKAKLFASLASLCLALAVLCFGVYAAQTVNYTANGSVTYDVTDVFVKIETKLYWSTSESPTTDVQTPANAFKNGETVANTALATTYTGTAYSTYENGTIKNPGASVTAESGTLPINYGKYTAGGTKSYAYYVVIEITNYGTDTINAVLTNNTTATTLNSIIYDTDSIEIAGRGTETSKVGRIVVGMALDDVTKSASGDFSYSVQISKGELPVIPTLDKLSFALNGTGYSVSRIDTTITTGKVVIPDTYNDLPVTSIGGYAFDGCTGITSIIIPSSVKTIGDYAFGNCTALRSIVIPNGVTSMGDTAFNRCESLTSVVIPSTLTQITEEPNRSEMTMFGGLFNPFIGCVSLQSITVEDGNTKYKAEGNCLIDIETNTLISGCKNSVIPNYVTSLGQGSFESTGLTSIVIPNNVTRIETRAFQSCTNIAEITIPASVIDMGMYVFEFWTNKQIIYVPSQEIMESWGRGWIGDVGNPQTIVKS